MAYAVIWALFFCTDRTPKDELYELGGPVSAILFACAIGLSYAASIVLGMPLISVLRRLNKVTFWWVVLPAALLGAIAITGCFFLLLAFGAIVKGETWRAMATFSLVGGALGAVVATTFCMLVGITSGGRGK
jgi:hypothetical protein